MIVMEPLVGSNIDDSIRSAITGAYVNADAVQFVFNGVTVQVRSDSDPGLIYRDWSRAMSGCIEKTVGPYPSPTLTRAEKAHDAQVEAESERRRQERQAAYEVEAAAKQSATDARLAEAPPMEFSDEAGWNDWKAKNTDSYGAGIFQYAEAWARLMQAEIATGAALEDVAEEAGTAADTEGITGFMYGAAVSILAACWVHGDQLRKWHNRQYGVGEDAAGTVNPAVLTISTTGQEG